METLRIFQEADPIQPASRPQQSLIQPDQSLTVGHLFDWFTRTFPAGSSAEAEAERLRVRSLFQAAFGPRLAVSITPREFLEWLKLQPKVQAANTRDRWKRTLQKPFREAAKLNLIPRNPLAGVKLPKGRQGRDWTDAEFRALCRGSPKYFRRLLVFIRYAGPRGAEVAGARWDQVDCQLATITQEEHKTAEITGEPRVLYLNKVTRRILELQLIDADKSPTLSEFIFRNSRGQPWKTHSLQKYFRLLRGRLGLPADLKLHGGRHAFGTRSTMAGNDVATTAVLLGHKSLLTTQRYLHLANQHVHIRAAAEKLAGLSDRV